MTRRTITSVIALIFWIVAPSLHAFTLLGPYAPWMTYDIGYRHPGDVGGPMDIDEGYRWNVPVITYGFDREFVDYFGQRGVEEVEKAVAILNDLPPATQIDLTNSPLEVWKQNGTAAALGLSDLKSAALATLLEQLGLKNSLESAWTIRDRVVDSNGTNFVVINRNFDPETLLVSPFINDEEYTYALFTNINNVNGMYADAVEFYASYAGIPGREPVVGNFPQAGWIADRLSRDDLGGLKFLLRSENQKVESLLPGIAAAPGNTNPIVDVALRPGVEKVRLVRMHLDGDQFALATNIFTDTFITNGVVQTQQLQRIVTEPDVLFRAHDFGLRFFTNPPGYSYKEFLLRSDTSGWQNNANLNDNPAGAGPGIIKPPAQITLAEVNRYGGLGFFSLGWASFEDSPEDIIVYGGSNTVSTATLNTQISIDAGQPVFVWTLLLQLNVNYRIDASGNLRDWTPVGNLINVDDGLSTFRYPISEEARYFRAVLDPQ